MLIYTYIVDYQSPSLDEIKRILQNLCCTRC